MIAAARTDVVDVLQKVPVGTEVRIWGWIRTARASKNLVFVQINDGSCLADLQVVMDAGSVDLQAQTRLLTGACVTCLGKVQESPAAGQARELHATELSVVGEADSVYPLQKKRHSLEFLRTVPHLRPRTRTFQATFRLRSALSVAIHEFFQSRGFVYVHTPLFTSNDCEGGGEMFRVTTLDHPEPGQSDYFGQRTFLSVSGQLEAEALALANGRVYTFGPIFRADPSDTFRHAAEFWMIEPEMAFYDLDDDMALVEAFLKGITEIVKRRCGPEIEFFSRNVEPGLLDRYAMVLDKPFETITFTEAIRLLQGHASRFAEEPKWECDLRAEHERFLAEEIFRCPVFVTHYPRHYKPFYMRVDDDERTVSCFDLLIPGIGEVLTGSQREERPDVLLRNVTNSGMNRSVYEWYLQTRRWGSAPHSGFGLGFERMLMYLSGMKNIRDVLPFPRYYGWRDISANLADD